MVVEFYWIFAIFLSQKVRIRDEKSHKKRKMAKNLKLKSSKTQKLQFCFCENLS